VCLLFIALIHGLFTLASSPMLATPETPELFCSSFFLAVCSLLSPCRSVSESGGQTARLNTTLEPSVVILL
jgi:hypothetical protein